jgi:hypothetical protein
MSPPADARPSRLPSGRMGHLLSMMYRPSSVVSISHAPHAVQWKRLLRFGRCLAARNLNTNGGAGLALSQARPASRRTASI